MQRISVIIPVYNVEPYLTACLDSVVNQTYPNLEIILVDDGSTDACPQICDTYAAQDNRIIVIHQENRGLSGARNTGLHIASGDLISFVDSDDLLSLNFYQQLFDILILQKSDIVECGYFKFETIADLSIIKNPINDKIENYETEKALELLMQEYIKQMVWNKLYRREVLLNIEFPEGKINEDEYWTYKVFGNSKQITKIADVLYYYRKQNESIMGKGYSLKRLDGLNALEERIQYMRKNHPLLENLAINKFCLGAIYHYRLLTITDGIDIGRINREKIYKKVIVYNQFSIYKHWKWTEIIYYKLFLLSPLFLYKIRKV